MFDKIEVVWKKYAKLCFDDIVETNLVTYEKDLIKRCAYLFRNALNCLEKNIYQKNTNNKTFSDFFSVNQP